MALFRMVVGGDSCNNLNSAFIYKNFMIIILHFRSRYASAINLINIGVCLIGAAAFAKASAVILAVVLVCLSAVIVSYLAQPAFEVF